MLEKNGDGTYTIPLSEECPITLKEWQTPHRITPMDDGTEVRTVSIDAPITNQERYEMCGLRPSFYKLSKELYLKAGKCQEILYWDKNTQFCGVCGAPMKLHTDISKRCTNCGKEVWPQLATAIIVLIHRGDDVLLVHARNFKGDFYGLVAGFVETGETLEEAVRREVMEETGLTIHNPHPCGFKDWILEDGTRYIVLLYKTDQFEGELKSSDEGRVFWLDRGDIDSANLIWNMRELMQIFETNSFSEFFFKIQNGTYDGKLLG